MIKRFSDHAANERTYLSWVRTSLAVIAFAIIIEKFSFIIRKNTALINQISANGDTKIIDESVSYITIILILTGLFMLIGATYRFMAIRNYLNNSTNRKQVPYTINLILGSLLIFITAAGLLYSFHILGELF